MENRKKDAEKKTEATEERAEQVLPGIIVPNEKWEDHARYMREVVNPDDT